MTESAWRPTTTAFFNRIDRHRSRGRAAGQTARPRHRPGCRAHPLHVGYPAALGPANAEPGCPAADPLPARYLDGRAAWATCVWASVSVIAVIRSPMTHAQVLREAPSQTRSYPRAVSSSACMPQPQASQIYRSYTLTTSPGCTGVSRVATPSSEREPVTRTIENLFVTARYVNPPAIATAVTTVISG